MGNLTGKLFRFVFGDVCVCEEGGGGGAFSAARKSGEYIGMRGQFFGILNCQVKNRTDRSC